MQSGPLPPSSLFPDPESNRVCLQGHEPPLQVALDLYNILSESDTNLRQPVGLENHLLKASMGSEVGQSMLQLLQVRVCSHPQQHKGAGAQIMLVFAAQLG